MKTVGFLFGVALLNSLFVLGAERVFPPESRTEEKRYDSLQDPRLGGAKGRLRYRVVRAPYELVETPDVVVLRDGTELEAYFLEAYGDWLVFYVKESANSWVKEEIPRSYVERIDFEQYLTRDPIEPPSIERARKQPVAKEEILSGAFEGSRGRFTRWKIVFRSEIDTYSNHTEDATEYGEFEVRSDRCQDIDGTRYAHGTRAFGRYSLYAPGTVNNRDWVLVLSEVVYSRIDRSPEAGFATERLPDESFVVRFGPEKDSFQLDWSTLGHGSWSALVGIPFERSPSAEPSKTAEPRSKDTKIPSPPPAPLRRDSGRDLVADAGEPREGRAPDGRRARSPSGDWWGPPRTYWEAKRTR